MSATPASTLANPDQRIADLQRQLAECRAELDKAQRNLNETTTERDEALVREAATAEVLRVINSSPGELAPVFEAVLQSAVRICEANFGALYLRETDAFRAVAMHNAPPAFAEARTRALLQPPPDAPLGQVAITKQVAHIADIRTHRAYVERHPFVVAAAELGNFRTVLSVPMLRDDELIGAITIYRQEVRPFTDKQIEVVRTFAEQAVIAIENARLITETREALAQQTATAEVLQVINSSPGNLAPVFDAILEKAHQLCGGVRGRLLIREGDEFHLVAAHGEAQWIEAVRQPGPWRPPEDAPLARLVSGERIVHIPDVRVIDHYRNTPSYKRLADAAGTRTMLMVPLRKDGALLGAITASRLEIRPFTDKQIALLQNFAAQAVIAMENARLLTETREALEQQTATAEVLGVINSSPGDLAPVFDALLEKATSLCDAAFGILLTWDGEYFHRVAWRGASDELVEALGEINKPVPGSLAGRIVSGESVIAIADLREGEAYVTGAPLPALARIGGARSLVAVALRKEDALLGVFSIFRQEVRPFTDKQIALVQNFAAQAVIAMENARLLTETREALEQQTATAEVLGVINSSPGDLAPVFDAMLEKTLRLCEAVHGNFLTYDGEVFYEVAFRGEPQFAEHPRHQGPRRLAQIGQLARAVQGGGTVHRIDAREDEAYRDDPSFRQMVDGLGIRTSLAVPLRKGDALLGVVRAYRREVRPFTDKQIALVQNFAAQAVIAMENARLLGELRQRTDEVAELNRGLEARVAEQVDELGRVGRLKRFLAPQLAELIVSQGDEKILESHRREIVVVFCDLRGYTAFTETAEPEEVLDFLREYHGALGPLVSQFEGTLDQFSGDGIMVFFNDPVPIPDPAERAVKMAIAMRETAAALIADWRERGRDLGFGAGIAQGYATLGQIGFSERSGYTAIGTVCNVAARLCAEAKDGQILLSQRVNVALKGSVATEQLGALALKGLTQPVVAYNVPFVGTPPALRGIEGGPQTI